MGRPLNVGKNWVTLISTVNLRNVKMNRYIWTSLFVVAVADLGIIAGLTLCCVKQDREIDRLRAVVAVSEKQHAFMQERFSDLEFKAMTAKTFEDGYREALLKSTTGTYADGYEAAQIVYGSSSYEDGYHNAISQFGYCPAKTGTYKAPEDEQHVTDNNADKKKTTSFVEKTEEKTEK